jgi:hypothetical protein
MIEILIQIIPAVISGIILYFTYVLSRILLDGGFSIPLVFSSVYLKTPGLNEFLLFVLRSFCFAFTVVCIYCRVSNHIIISLDILYLFSILIIYLFHSLKVYWYPLFNNTVVV